MLAAMAILITAIYGRLIRRFTEGWDSLQPPSGSDKPEVTVSVVVAYRNEKSNLPFLLEALCCQDYPQALFEVILVNDHSTDGSEIPLTGPGDMSGFKFLDLPAGLSGKKSALQYGIAHAGRQLILTTDADCRPGREWIGSMTSAYARNKYKMIAGPVAFTDPRGYLAAFQSMEFISLVSSGAGAIGAGMPVMCNGANLLYERTAFIEVGGFKGNEHIPGGDDIFLLEKFKKKFGNRQIGFVKDRAAIIYTDAATGLRSFLNQRFRWVAKSPAYRDFHMIFTAMVVLLVNLGLLATLLWGIWSAVMILVFGVMFLLKCLIDMPILWKASGFFGQRRLMAWYLPFQFTYIIFVSLTGILGNIVPYRWKEPGPHRSVDL